MVGFRPKSSILIGISIINRPIWGPPIFGSTPRYGWGKPRSLSKKVFGSTPREMKMFSYQIHQAEKTNLPQIRMNLHFLHPSKNLGVEGFLFPSCPKKIQIFLENQHVPWKSINGWKMYFLVTWSFFRGDVSVWGRLSLVVFMQRRLPWNSWWNKPLFTPTKTNIAPFQRAIP